MTAAANATVEVARQELDAAARELFVACRDSAELTEPISYLIGALYSLRWGQQLGIPDRAATARSADSPLDLAKLGLEVVRGELRTTGRWVQGFWANNAALRIAASFERICLAVGYATSGATEAAQREADARMWFRRERDQHLRGTNGARTSELGTVWDAVNTQKHDFCAPKHANVAAINEIVLVRALTIVLLLAAKNMDRILGAYQSTAELRPRPTKGQR